MKRANAGGADFAVQFGADCALVRPPRRLRLAAHCASALNMPMDQCLALDTSVYARHGGEAAAYLDQMRNLIYNVTTNAALRAVPPARLVQMTDEEMREGTVLEAIERDGAQRQANFEAMLQQRYDSVDHGRSIMRCRRCGKSNLAFEQKQTRGCDESMTVFVSCKDCGANWKL